jgi:hypothetical protein
MPDPVARGRCGRYGREPLHARFLRYLGVHKTVKIEKRRVRLRHDSDETVIAPVGIIGWTWDSHPGRNVYLCWRRADHFKITVKPPLDREVRGWDVNSLRGPLNQRRLRVLRVLDGDALGLSVMTRTVPTRSWELGHQYKWARWEPA